MTALSTIPVFLHSFAKEDKFAERCTEVLKRMSSLGDKYSITFRILSSRFSLRENEQRWLRQAQVILAVEMQKSDFVKWAMKDELSQVTEQFCMDLVDIVLNKIEEDSYVMVSLHDEKVIGATLFRLLPFKGRHERDILYKYKIVERFMRIAPWTGYPLQATERFFDMIKCVEEVQTRMNEYTIPDDEPTYGLGRVIREYYYADVLAHADYSQEIAQAYTRKMELQATRPDLYRSVEDSRRNKQRPKKVSDVIHDDTFKETSENLLFRVFIFTMDTLALDCTARTFQNNKNGRPTNLEKAAMLYGFQPLGDDKVIESSTAGNGLNHVKCRLLLRVTDPRVPWDKMSLNKLTELSL